MKKKLTETCEMCGETITHPITIKIEGALLTVCPKCASFGKEVRDKSQINKPGNISKKTPHTIKKIQKSSSYSEEGERILSDNFNELIKNARMKLKLTQEQLSKKTGITVAAIKSFEAGKIRPTDTDIKKLERELHISLYASQEADIQFSDPSKIKNTKFGDIAVIKRFDYNKK